MRLNDARIEDLVVRGAHQRHGVQSQPKQVSEFWKLEDEGVLCRQLLLRGQSAHDDWNDTDSLPAPRLSTEYVSRPVGNT